VPGWLLAGMVIASLGCGFVLGRTLHGAEGDRGLAKGTAGAESPAGFGLRVQAGYLDDAADQAVLGHEFYVVRLHVDAEKHKAAHLAQQLRALGLHRARIRRFHSDEGSTSLWATLCYASSISAYGPAENQECWDRDTLLELNKHAAALGYDEIARPLKAPIPDATRPPGDGR
jgi:hypothetical protein